MHVSRRVLILAILAAIPAACGGPEPSESEPMPRTAVGVVEDLRIGASSGPEEYLFGRIGGVVQHDSGTISILDTQVPVIRQYDAEGAWLRDVGGEGQGPGEYSERVQGMQRLPDDNFAIFDSGNSRISVFSPSGEFVDSFHSTTAGYFSGSTMWVDDAGNYYLYVTDHSAPLREGEFPPTVFKKLSPAGEVLETIAVPDDDPETPGWVFATGEGYLRNFTHQTLHTLTKGGALVVGHNGSYSYQVQHDGETVLEVEHPWEPVALAPEERAEWEAWREYFAERARQDDRLEQAEYEPIPTAKPAFMNLHGGLDGSVWVRRYAQARERTDRDPRPPDDPRPTFNWWQPITLDAFDEEGQFLGTVELPNDTWVVSLSRDRIWTVQPNEDDESVAVRYRVEGMR